MSATLPRASAERERRILEHQGLCRRGARRFLRRGLERSDLEQVAALGLIKAADRFDPSNGTPFSAYAWMLILSELGHYVRAHEYPVRPPRALRSLERRHAAAWEVLAARSHSEPGRHELASALATAPEAIAQVSALQSALRPQRLDDPSERAARERSLPDPADDLAIALTLRALPADQRAVLRGVYWLGLTFVELGCRLGRSPKTVARVHRDALARLRAHWPPR